MAKSQFLCLLVSHELFENYLQHLELFRVWGEKVLLAPALLHKKLKLLYIRSL